ncbi:hypothetical protein, partial [Clavibacter michiganensis]|uniref:hypothetical protein n=1 Tax=Clavibacter michiganensis TaxID=28447 RepID=UPI0029315FD4
MTDSAAPAAPPAPPPLRASAADRSAVPGRGVGRGPPAAGAAYYEDVGRAGRAGEPAVGILHYRAEDLGLRRFFTARTPRPAPRRG